MRIEWSQRSHNDLRDLKDYIAKDSPFYARQFIERIIHAAETLTEHPKIGRLVPEAEREDVREIIYQGYRILYLIKPDHLYIVAVFHGSRDLAGMDIKPWNVG